MSEAKEKILKQIDTKWLIQVSKLLVETPSVTGQETELAKRLAEFMKSRGFQVELQDVENGRLQIISRIKGSGGGKSMMLCGHLDMFPPPLSMKDPYKSTIKDNRIYGAAIGDMKAGDACIITAADALIKSEIELKGDIIIALTMGEEMGGVGVNYLLKSGVKADMGVVPESTNLQITTTGAGIAKFQISTIGKSMHISNMEDGIDAISKMCKVVDALKKIKFTYEPDPRVPKLPRIIAGTIIGGRGKNYDLQGPQNLSDYCTLLINVRFWKSQTDKSIESDLIKCLDKIAKNDPEFKYELKEGYEPFTSSTTRPVKDVPLDAPIIGIVKKNHEYVTGVIPKFRTTKDTMGSDDGAQMNNNGISTITYGPGPGKKLGNYKKLNLVERWIDLDTMNTCTKVLALSSFDVCNMKK